MLDMLKMLKKLIMLNVKKNKNVKNVWNVKNVCGSESQHLKEGGVRESKTNKTKQERVALQERKESSFYKKWQASDNKYQITSNR